MATIKKAVALGGFLMACNKFDTGARGEKQKLQKIVGEKVFYKSGNTWYYGTQYLKTLTVAQLNKLTKLVQEA